MSSRHALAVAAAVALTTRCTALPVGGVGTSFGAGALFYGCYVQGATGLETTGDANCNDFALNPLYTPSPRSIATGAHFSVDASAYDMEIVAPGLILASTDTSDFAVNGRPWRGPLITALRAGTATVLGLGIEYSADKDSVSSVLYLHVRDATSIRVVGVMSSSGGPLMEMSPYPLMVGQSEIVVVNPFDGSAQLAGLLDCTWSSADEIVALATGSFLRGTIVGRNTGVATIDVACHGLSTTFEVRVMGDAGFDSGFDADVEAGFFEGGDDG